MSAVLARNALDLGVVTTDAGAALKFYCETLGFPHLAEIPIPNVGVVHRLKCGESLVKILVLANAPAQRASGGGFAAATGIRYFSLSVTNLAELAEKCRAGGYKIVVEPYELRPGVNVALIEDTDGNTLELMQGA